MPANAAIDRAACKYMDRSISDVLFLHSSSSRNEHKSSLRALFDDDDDDDDDDEEGEEEENGFKGGNLA